MRVFLTGATGFIGSRVLPQLQAAGHEVIGLTRSAEGEQTLLKAGATPHLGDLDDLESLRAGAAAADAVVHTAFDHNFANFLANCEKDRQAILAMGEAMTGNGPLIITSGVAMGDDASGAMANEDIFNAEQPNPRKASELAGQVLIAAGRDVRVIRLPQVHNAQRQGLLNGYIQFVREKGVASYVGDGANRWSAAHVDDVAKVYTLALDRGGAGARYNAVGEEGVRALDVVETIARRLNIPTRSIPASEAAKEFGWLAMFVGVDLSASAALTRARLSWNPVGRSLIEDLEARDYSK